MVRRRNHFNYAQLPSPGAQYHPGTPYHPGALHSPHTRYPHGTFYPYYPMARPPVPITPMSPHSPFSLPNNNILYQHPIAPNGYPNSSFPFMQGYNVPPPSSPHQQPQAFLNAPQQNVLPPFFSHPPGYPNPSGSIALCNSPPANQPYYFPSPTPFLLPESTIGITSPSSDPRHSPFDNQLPPKHLESTPPASSSKGSESNQKPQKQVTSETGNEKVDTFIDVVTEVDGDGGEGDDETVQLTDGSAKNCGAIYIPGKNSADDIMDCTSELKEEAKCKGSKNTKRGLGKDTILKLRAKATQYFNKETAETSQDKSLDRNEGSKRRKKEIVKNTQKRCNRMKVLKEDFSDEDFDEDDSEGEN